jgi:hypothetical protein
MMERITMLEKFDNDQINRQWELFLRAEDNFYNRLNFFLVFESVLLGIIGVLYSRPNPAIPMLIVLGVLGLILTGIWAYTQWRQLYICRDLRNYLGDILPEYKAILARRKRWLISSMVLLTFVPAVVSLVWLVFLLLFVFGT